MAEDYQKLAQGQLSGTGVDSLYTVPTDQNVIIKEIRIVNTDTSNHWVEVYDVDADGSAGDSNVIIPEITIEAGGWLVEHGEITGYDDGTASSPKEIKAESDSTLTYTLYGVEVS